MRHKKLLLAILIVSVLVVIFIIAVSKPAEWHEADSTLNLEATHSWQTAETWQFHGVSQEAWKQVESWSVNLDSSAWHPASSCLFNIDGSASWRDIEVFGLNISPD